MILVLRETGLGKAFFGGVAQPEPLRNILRQVSDACKKLLHKIFPIYFSSFKFHKYLQSYYYFFDFIHLFLLNLHFFTHLLLLK